MINEVNMEVISTISNIIIWVYVIAIIPAIFFTYMQEKSGMKVQNAPNKFIGIIHHFITVWLIVPFFFIKLLNNRS